jgi:hypothetical protein
MVWNIEGGYKLYDSVVKQYVQEFDVCGFVETWLGEKSEVPVVEGLELITRVSAKKYFDKAKGRKSGGIIVYAKSGVKASVVEVESNSRGSVWVKCQKNESVFLLCFVYNPPADSKYSLPMFYEDLALAVIEVGSLVNDEAPILLLGDFNARAGQLDDSPVVAQEESEDRVGVLWETEVALRSRNSVDNTSNAEGRKLIDFCSVTGFRIINGRTRSDEVGDFTFLGPQGKSCIDYALVPSQNFDCVKDLKLGTMVESCHVPLELVLAVHSSPPESNVPEDITENESDVWKRIPKYKWAEEKEQQIATEVEVGRAIFDAAAVLLPINGIGRSV